MAQAKILRADMLDVVVLHIQDYLIGIGILSSIWAIALVNNSPFPRSFGKPCMVLNRYLYSVVLQFSVLSVLQSFAIMSLISHRARALLPVIVLKIAQDVSIKFKVEYQFAFPFYESQITCSEPNCRGGSSLHTRQKCLDYYRRELIMWVVVCNNSQYIRLLNQAK